MRQCRRYGEEKNNLPLTGFESWPVQCIALSLYQLPYLNGAVYKNILYYCGKISRNEFKSGQREDLLKLRKISGIMGFS
jgi:hypothetical protein